MTSAFTAAAAVADGLSVTATILLAAGIAAPVIRQDARAARQSKEYRRLMIALGGLRTERRDEEAQWSATNRQIRALSALQDDITVALARMEEICKSTGYATGWLDGSEGRPPSREQLRGLRPLDWTPPN